MGGISFFEGESHTLLTFLPIFRILKFNSKEEGKNILQRTVVCALFRMKSYTAGPIYRTESINCTALSFCPELFNIHAYKASFMYMVQSVIHSTA